MTSPSRITRRTVATVLVLFALFLFRGAEAASFSLNPVADAFVTAGASGNLVNSNYGLAGALSVAASGLAQGEFQSLLRFDLTGAKSAFDTQFGVGQWSIQSVALQLTATAPNNAIFNSSAAGQFGLSWMQNDSWIEGTGSPNAPSASGITFATLSSFLSGADEGLGTFSFNGATSGNNTYNLSLSSSFSADILAGSTLSLRMLAADSSVSYLFDSRNFGTASARPLLTITAVPEPSALLLVGLFLPVLLYRVRGSK